MLEALSCIAIAILFEAGGEPSYGQLAVAQVIRNRMVDPRYPSDACQVVKQGYYWQGFPIRNRCQFSFYCDGKSDNPKDRQQYYNALYIAWLSSIREDVTGGATHYHAIGSFPNWADTKYLTKRINNHIFYLIP